MEDVDEKSLTNILFTRQQILSDFVNTLGELGFDRIISI